MVKRLFVSGLTCATTIDMFRKHFEKFGSLYECDIPKPLRYDVVDLGADDADINSTSHVRFRLADSNDVLDDDCEVETFDVEKHGSFEQYTKLVGDGELFKKRKQRQSAGYGFVTFVDRNGFNKCMEEPDHIIDGVECSVELYKEEEGMQDFGVRSKKIFVCFYPLERLTVPEIKDTFRSPFGKIKDVEFVTDSEGPLFFCIITFSSEDAVDECLKRNLSVRGHRLLVRRGITREAIKLAEQKSREVELTKSREQHGYAGYNTSNIAERRIFSGYFPSKTNPNVASQATEQAGFQAAFNFDPDQASAMAGNGPYLPGSQDDESSNKLSGYGYGPRAW